MSFNFEIKLDKGSTLKNLISTYKQITEQIELCFFDKGIYIAHSNQDYGIIISTILDKSWFLKNYVEINGNPIQEGQCISIKANINEINQSMKNNKKSENITISNDHDKKFLYFKYSEGEDSTIKSIPYEYSSYTKMNIPTFTTNENNPMAVADAIKFSETCNGIPSTPCSVITDNQNGFIFVGNAIKKFTKSQPGVLAKFGNCDDFSEENTKNYYIEGKYLKTLNKLKAISSGTIKLFLENDILKIISSVGCYGFVTIFIKCTEFKES